MSFEHIDNQFIDTLESSGIIDAYEYVIRKLIEEDCPRDHVYDRCSRYLLEYEKLALNNNVRAKNVQKFIELTNQDDGNKKEIKAKEIIPSFPITLRSKLLYEQEENLPPQRIFETNIDELMKNKINLLTKNSATNVNKSNLESYGSYAAFVENENQKIREYNFQINTNFSNFQFIPMEEIEKSSGENLNSNNNMDNNNTNTNLKSDTEFIVPTGGERMNTGPSRRNTERSKGSKTETVSSKSITPSQEAKKRQESHNIVNDLMKKK